MKKTLTLLVLLMIAGPQSMAETVAVFTDGYSASNYSEAYNNAMYGSMCWAANASNVIAWWQDQLAAQGYAVPKDAPKQANVYPEYQAAFDNTGGYTENAIEWWIDGYYYNGWKSHEGHPGNFYDDLFNQGYGAFDMDSLVMQFYPSTFNTLQDFSQKIKESLEDGYALTMRIPSKSYNITVWGADYDKNSGLLTGLYYSDPHSPSKVWHGDLTASEDSFGTATYFLSGQGLIGNVNGLTCHVEPFLTEVAYTDTGEGAFSPVCNAVVDGGKSYTLASELKAAGQDSALKDKVHGDLTLKDGTATIADGGSLQGSVKFSDAEKQADRKLAVTRDALEVSKIVVNATKGGNALEIAEGKAMIVDSMEGTGVLTLTGKGTLVNGDSLLSAIEVKNGTLQGSGTFASVIVDGGTLIVGNSPGQQTYTGDLTVNLGDIVFSVDGWDTAADATTAGWGNGVYSNIDMGSNDLTLSGNCNIRIALGSNALAELTSGKEGSFSMDLVTGIDKVGVFDSDLLEQLALQTLFFAAGEDGALPENLDAGSDLKSYLRDMEYSMNGGVLTLKGSYGPAAPVPEPATGTLSLLALAGLAARRRRK